jgi:Flp pilus assembly protein TadG
MKQRIRRTTAIKSNARGTQIAELAIVLPLLLFLALAVTEGAYMIRVHQVLNNAAREGARLAMQKENSPPDLNNGNPVTDCSTFARGNNANPLCYAIIAYAENNGITPGSGMNQCNGAANANGLNITITQNVIIPNGAASMDGTQVRVVCPYTLTFLPRIPGFGIVGTVNLTGNVVFKNFY